MMDEPLSLALLLRRSLPPPARLLGWRQQDRNTLQATGKCTWEVPMSGRHGDQVQIGVALRGTVLTQTCMVLAAQSDRWK